MTGHLGGDAATRAEFSLDPTTDRLTGGNKVIEEAIDSVFVKDALRPIALQIKLERLQFHASCRGRICKDDGSEIGLTCLGTECSKFRANDFDGVLAPGILIGKCFELTR